MNEKKYENEKKHMNESENENKKEIEKENMNENMNENEIDDICLILFLAHILSWSFSSRHL